MASLLLTVFILQLLLHIVNTLGGSAINDVLWHLYNRFPTPTSQAANEQLRLRREVVKLKRQLHGVSAQDDFAKWAKLRRQHDKAVADYDKLSSSLSATKSTFDSRLTLARTVLLSGLRFVLQFWYVKRALFWIPKGWLPKYAEWVLSFPRAPSGSVSIQVWGYACASVIGMVSEAVVAAAVIGMRGLRRSRGAARKSEEKKAQ